MGPNWSYGWPSAKPRKRVLNPQQIAWLNQDRDRRRAISKHHKKARSVVKASRRVNRGRQ